MAKAIFKIQLDGVELSKAQTDGLQKAINAAATTYLAKNVKTVPNSVWGMKNPEWLGIWLKNFANLETLKKAVDFKKVAI